MRRFHNDYLLKTIGTIFRYNLEWHRLKFKVIFIHIFTM